MGTYDVTEYVTRGSAEVVAVALEAKLETITNNITIRFIDISKEGNEFVGFLIYDS